MENNLSNKEQLDVFSSLVKQKLENHPSPMEVPAWGEIEGKLKPKRKQTTWWLWMPIGSAAVLALLFMAHPLFETSKTTAKSHKNEIINVDEKSKNNFADAVQNHKTSSNSVKQNFAFIHKIIPLDKQPVVENSVVQSSQIDLSTATEKQAEKVILSEKTHNSNVEAGVNLDDTTKVIQKRKFLNLEMAENKSENGIHSNNISWTMVAALGSGDGNSSNEVSGFQNNGGVIGQLTPVNPNAPQANYENFRYFAPLSIELLVRKNIIKTVALESGLVYTYLFSTFNDNAVQRNSAQLHLHYVGIPLNISMQVWNSSNWGIYTTIGGMIEKGVTAVQIESVDANAKLEITSTKASVNGFQYSINGAVGFNYKLQQNLGLFFEPKLAYNFDNNQPLSIRTVQPLTLGFSAGLRLKLN